MKKRLKEIEEEASALREMQAKVEKEMGAVQGFYSQTTPTDIIYADLFIYLLYCLRCCECCI